MKTLAKQERQDFVDGEVFRLIKKLIPETTSFERDIDIIGDVRDTIRRKIVREKKLMTEQEFYP